MNYLTLNGRLANDIKLNHTAKGTPVCNFTLADNVRGADGEESVVYFKCTLWGERALAFSDTAKKGESVSVWGEMKADNYSDSDGKPVYDKVITVDRIQWRF